MLAIKLNDTSDKFNWVFASEWILDNLIEVKKYFDFYEFNFTLKLP